MNLFLHCCCGPCAAGSIPQLLESGYQPFCWFYNPNIHPFQEHKSRRLAFVELMEQLGLEYAVNADYPLEGWLRQVADAPEQRCSYCYCSRLEAAAAEAAQRGFKAYTTTLLVSPYQNQELIAAIGRECAAQQGIDFVFQDLRPGFREGQTDARERGLYMQKYCGCIYSEKERYAKKRRPAKNEEKTKDGEHEKSTLDRLACCDHAVPFRTLGFCGF